MLRDATQASLLDVLDRNCIPFDFHKSESTILLNDIDSKILLRSLDDAERLRGTNLAWFGLDELTYASEEAWTRMEARLRDPGATELCGFGVWTPKGYDWVYHRFIENSNRGYEVTMAAAFENTHVLDLVPDYYERLKTSYEESFYLQEAMGSYINYKGRLVYPAFSRQVNVAKQAIYPSLPLLWSMDFNVDPMCSVVAQRHNDDLFVLDEIVLPAATTIDACGEFLSKFRSHPAAIRIYGDVSGNSRKTVPGTDYEFVKQCLAPTFGARLSMHVGKTNPAVRDRILMMNAKLKTAAGHTSLFVSPDCRELIQDFEQVVHKDNSDDIDKTKDRRRTHLSDALGYLVWEEFRPQQQIGERNRPLF